MGWAWKMSAVSAAINLLIAPFSALHGDAWNAVALLVFAVLNVSSAYYWRARAKAA